jgi:methylmalonyl-CoA mutase N-terminal domain/subunit
VALRTQQVIGYETAVPLVADPLGGSYYVESLTDRVEEEALGIMAEMDEGGGAVACIESGWTQRRIGESAYRLQKRIESGERVVVGVNRFEGSDSDKVDIMKISPRHQAAACAPRATARCARRACWSDTARRSRRPHVAQTT